MAFTTVLLSAALLAVHSLANDIPHHQSNPPYPHPYGPKGSSSQGHAGVAPTATIDAGVLIGTTTSLPAATATVNKFLGVPFASPPIRFAPPQKPAKSSNPINVTSWSPACIQQFVYPKVSQEFTEVVFNSPAPQESEDCLYLNVYAPSTPAPADGRAVLFWIYGGSLQFGNAGQPTYDGSGFASYEDVIVVTTNYRTNVFGFPSSPELPETSHNLGFLDQRLALDWVQRNIHAFGGSPEKVTIFGESAGAFSVDCLLTSFPANSTPPFRGAILESGQYSYRATPYTSSVPAWDTLVAALECPGKYSSNLTCVRAANATEIQQIVEEQVLEFNPSPDGVTLVQSPAKQRLSGNIAYVPVLGGTNAQEGRADNDFSSVFTVGQTNTTAYLTNFFGNATSLITAIESAYPTGSLGISNAYDQISQIFTEYYFQCAQAHWANDTAAIGIPAWRYLFNASFPNTQAYPGLGVYHSSEIPIVFGTYSGINATAQEYALSKTMMGVWARFAKNPLAGPGWNAVGTGAAGPVLVGAASSAVGGLVTGVNGTVQTGAWDLGLFGNRDNVLGSGVTVVDQYELDYRCGLYRPVYGLINGLT